MHVATGAVDVNVNGVQLEAGDAVRVTAETQLRLEDAKQAHVLVFDLPTS